MTGEELSVLKRYLSTEKAVEEFSLREHLRAALENFVVEVGSYILGGEGGGLMQGRI